MSGPELFSAFLCWTIVIHTSHEKKMLKSIVVYQLDFSCDIESCLTRYTVAMETTQHYFDIKKDSFFCFVLFSEQHPERKCLENEWFSTDLCIKNAIFHCTLVYKKTGGRRNASELENTREFLKRRTKKNNEKKQNTRTSGRCVHLVKSFSNRVCLFVCLFVFFRRNAVKWGWPPMSNIKCHLIDCQSRVIERNITVFSTRSATEWRQHQINELHMDSQRLNNKKNKLRNLSEIKKRKNAGGCDNNGTRSHVHSQYTVTCFFLYIQQARS